MITAALVTELVGTQFPAWAELPLRPVELDGWDNRTFRLGQDMAVRLPSSETCAGQVGKEDRWLSVLAPPLASADS
jgi:aminoglycoside phosphotransferase (APT) family kinase protein